MTLEVWKQLVAQMSEIEDAVERTENPSAKVRKTDQKKDSEKEDEEEDEKDEKDGKDEKEDESEED